MSDVKNTPKLRFPEFSGDWERCKLGEVVERVKSYSLSRNVETQEHTGFKYIHYGDIHRGIANIISSDKILPNIQAGKFEHLKQGDLVLADASEDYDGVGASCVIDCFLNDNLVAGLHTIAIRPTQANHLFLYYLLNTQAFKEYGRLVGTGTKVVGISPTNLLKFTSYIPKDKTEQTAIGNFFRQLDELIKLHERKFDHTNALKAGLLQKMFPKNGQSVPEIRFPEFSGDWERCKLGELLKKQIKGKAQFEKLSSGNVEYLDASRLNNESLFLSDGIKDVNCEDILIMWDGSNAGKVYTGFEGVLGSTLKAYTTKDEIHSQFVYQFLAKEEEIIFRQYRTPNIPHIVKNFADIFDISIPPTKTEQTAIGNFFRQLDELIALRQRKLEHLKELKKALLQQMFVLGA